MPVAEEEDERSECPARPKSVTASKFSGPGSFAVATIPFRHFLYEVTTAHGPRRHNETIAWLT